MSDHEDALRLIIDRAQATLDGQAAAGDAQDLKALGVAAVDAAVLGVLIASHNSIDRLWGIPAVALVAAGFLFMLAIARRNFDRGPDWRTFYETYGGKTGEAVAAQMLSDLLNSIAFNDRRERAKGRFYEAGFRLSILALIGAGLVGLVR